MDDAGDLLVGSFSVCSPDGVDDEVLAVFRDDMLHVARVPAAEYEHMITSDGPYVEAAVFGALGCVIADRLDLMGISAARVLADLDRTLKAAAAPMNDADLADDNEESRAFIRAEEAMLGAMTAQDWVSRLAASPDDPGARYDKSLGALGWLLRQLEESDDVRWDARRRLRLALLAFPDAEVTLDVTWLGEYGWFGGEPGAVASRAQGASRDNASSHAPVIVLTEGITDAEFLSKALVVLHPHLTDLVRFLDYERKPEGSASAVLRAVRAFDAAGIANRVVAVLDNDTAAADALRGHAWIRLSDGIRVIQYPPLRLARQYPTLGPPTVGSPAGAIELADVNGLAASIELYLGRDVLTREDGSLRPVQWKAFIAGMERYHGEVTDKNDIHKAFRAKATVALQDPAAAGRQDWEGLRLILDAILTAFTA
jgi:hypothetical protein